MEAVGDRMEAVEAVSIAEWGLIQRNEQVADVVLGDFSLERMIRAVEKVRDRLLRSARALDEAGVPYAIAGANAVAAWVSRVDEAAVRNTQDVGILLQRGDLDRATTALATAGFLPPPLAGNDKFLGRPPATCRDVGPVALHRQDA